MGVVYPERLSNILKIAQLCCQAGTQPTYPEHLLCVRHVKSHIVCRQVPVMSCLSSNPGYRLEGNTRGWTGWHFKGNGSGRARGVPRLGVGVGVRSEGEQRGLPGGRALGVGAWKMVIVLLFPGEVIPPFFITTSQELTSSQKSASAMSTRDHAPSPTSSPSPSPNSVLQTWPSHCSPAWPHPQPQEGELATARWGVQAAVGPTASSPCSGGFSYQVSSRFLCLRGSSPGTLSRFP